MPLMDRMISALSGLEFNCFYRHCFDQIIVLSSEALKNQSWRDNVSLIPNPLIYQHNLRSTLTSKTVISVGRLIKTKNMEALIRIWLLVHLSHPDWTLVIYGDGPLKLELEKLIKESNLQDSVFLNDATNDVIKKMSNASIFAFSSLIESFGMVIVEAQVLWSSCCGIRLSCWTKRHYYRRKGWLSSPS